MARRHYNLPPLTTLASFEVAARHLSFKVAARELNVTPGAVSHQIKALENDLGIQLFERIHRGVSLTEHGEKLYSALQQSFNDISETLSYIRRAASGNSVTISATTAVSALWLTPRLAGFWKAHGEIPINQLLSDHPPPQGQIVDLSIKYGASRGPNKISHKLFSDSLTPVCSPEFAKDGSSLSLADLARQPLIHVDADDKSWTTWESWFRELGYRGDIATGLHVNNYMIALQAAEDGAGIVLGWQQLIRPLLEQRKLASFGRHSLEAPHSFYLIMETDDRLPHSARITRDWLLANQ
ncbi:MAG: LysR substrate-binding domain-containing protein [Proteobacteria bacterium]|nr:LysR substrate-binding domain-containing protein [Pseudomonadota bacterium]